MNKARLEQISDDISAPLAVILINSCKCEVSKYVQECPATRAGERAAHEATCSYWLALDIVSIVAKGMMEIYETV